MADGYFLIKLTDAHPVSFEQEREAIERLVLREKLGRQLLAYYDTLHVRYNVRYEPDGLAGRSPEAVVAAYDGGVLTVAQARELLKGQGAGEKVLRRELGRRVLVPLETARLALAADPDLQRELERLRQTQLARHLQDALQAQQVPPPNPNGLSLFYEEHKRRYTAPAEVEVRRLLVRDQAEGTAIVERMRAGRDTTALIDRFVSVIYGSGALEGDNPVSRALHADEGTMHGPFATDKWLYCLTGVAPPPGPAAAARRNPRAGGGGLGGGPAPSCGQRAGRVSAPAPRQRNSLQPRCCGVSPFGHCPWRIIPSSCNLPISSIAGRTISGFVSLPFAAVCFALVSGHYLPGAATGGYRLVGDHSPPLRHLAARLWLACGVRPLQGAVHSRPVLLVAFAYGLIQWAPLSLVLIVTLWDHQHSLMQQYGFARVYDFKAKAGAPATAKFDLAFNWIFFGNMLVVSPLFSAVWVRMLHEWHLPIGADAVETVHLVSWIIAIAYGLIYLGHIAYCVRRGLGAQPPQVRLFAVELFPVVLHQFYHGLSTRLCGGPPDHARDPIHRHGVFLQPPQGRAHGRRFGSPALRGRQGGRQVLSPAVRGLRPRLSRAE